MYNRTARLRQATQGRSPLTPAATSAMSAGIGRDGGGADLEISRPPHRHPWRSRACARSPLCTPDRHASYPRTRLRRLGPPLLRRRHRRPAQERQGRPRRPQRRRQVHPLQADQGRARPGLRRDQPAQGGADRLGRSGASGHPGLADGYGAGRRRGARPPDGGTGDGASRRAGRDLCAADRDRRRPGALACGRNPVGPRLLQRRPRPADGRVLRRLAHAGGARRRPLRRTGPAAAGRTDQLSRPGRGPVAGGAAAELSLQRPDHQPRPRTPEQFGRSHPAPGRRQARPLSRRLRRLRNPAGREGPPAGGDAGQGRGQARPHAVLRRPLPRQGQQGAPGPVPPEGSRQTAGDRRGGARARRPLHPALPRTAAGPAAGAAGGGQRRLWRPADPAGTEPAAGRGRPHRPAGGQRRRQVDLRQDDRRGPADRVRRHAPRPAHAGGLVPPAPDRGARSEGHPPRHHPARHARGLRGLAAVPSGAVRLPSGEGGDDRRRPFRRRAGAPAAQHGRRRGAPPADPRRADQPPGHRFPARPAGGAEHL